MNARELETLEAQIERLEKMSDDYSRRELRKARAAVKAAYDLDPRQYFVPWSVLLSGIVPIEDDEELLPVLHFLEDNPRRWTQVRQLAQRMPVEQCKRITGMCAACGEEFSGQHLLFGFVNHSNTAPHRQVRFIHAGPCDATKKEKHA